MRNRWIAALIVLATATTALAVGVGAHHTKATAVTAPEGPAVRVFMQVTGQKQGAIGGSVSRSRIATPAISGQIPVYAVSHSVVSPRDAASGLPTGQRQHKPYVVTIDWSKASPQLYSALVTNENLTSVYINFYEISGSVLRKYATVKLTNANIASIDERLPGPSGVIKPYPQDSAASHYQHMEQVAFTYQKIEWINVSPNTMSQDDWETP